MVKNSRSLLIIIDNLFDFAPPNDFKLHDQEKPGMRLTADANAVTELRKLFSPNGFCAKAKTNEREKQRNEALQNFPRCKCTVRPNCGGRKSERETAGFEMSGLIWFHAT